MLGSVAAIVIFAILLHLAGVDELVDQVAMAESTYLIAVLAIAFVWFVAWGAPPKTALGMLGMNVSTVRSLLIFMGATFSSSITPFEQAGGEPVTVLLISRSIDAGYEVGLAVVVSVDVTNLVPPITITLIGVGYYVTETTLDHSLEIALVAVIALAAGAPAAVYTA